MSDDSRGGSPDWIRNFQSPCAGSILSLSSDSGSSPANHSPTEEPGKIAILIDSGDELPEDLDKGFQKPSNGKQTTSDSSRRQSRGKKAGKQNQEKNHIADKEMNDVHGKESGEEDAAEKPVMTNVSSRLPLVMSDKVQRSKALVECDDESVDLSGDVGAVGRVVISETASGSHEMLLDLKGTIYKTAIVPSRTFCVVSFGQSEAKVEAIMNDFIQLKPHSNVFEAETVIEGVLDGFSFDMDDEGDRETRSSANRGTQGDKSEDHPDEVSRAKPGRTLVSKRKKATVAAKPPKKIARKTQTTRKAKTSKK